MTLVNRVSASSQSLGLWRRRKGGGWSLIRQDMGGGIRSKGGSSKDEHNGKGGTNPFSVRGSDSVERVGGKRVSASGANPSSGSKRKKIRPSSPADHGYPPTHHPSLPPHQPLRTYSEKAR
ncbi:hypothetical protein HNY73_007530 [Argiope bruennichi]|uniref:Uncharacterized protein n=1 Tax=Argiope bruennichi TaxID=94029 RepID=A0A8T0FF52_ARGBR|nr:hypothetical protein HNY73_007530 [Argiope bruennichi]